MNFCCSRRTLISILTLLGTTAGAGLIASGEASLAMTVAPALSFAPAELRVRFDVTPSAGNRSLFVVAESEEFYRSSEMPLDGEESPRSITVQFRGLPGGEYSVTGEVRDAAGRRLATVRQEIRVLPFSGIH